MILLFLMFVSLHGALQQPAEYQQLVEGLRATDLGARMAAVAELERRAADDQFVLADSPVQEAIVALLENENALIAERVAAVRRGGVSERSERYSEYYSQVLGIANGIRSDHRPVDPVLVTRLLRGLVFGTYNPDSRFVKDLAREGETIVPFVEELARAADGPSKWNAYGLVKELFAHQETRALTTPLTQASEVSLRTLARNGLLDPASDVRLWAIFAVSSARDQGAIPILERMARSDPDPHTGRYSVRAQAALALRRLR